jgi:hypothetical protein
MLIRLVVHDVDGGAGFRVVVAAAVFGTASVVFPFLVYRMSSSGAGQKGSRSKWCSAGALVIPLLVWHDSRVQRETSPGGGLCSWADFSVPLEVLESGFHTKAGT